MAVDYLALRTAIKSAGASMYEYRKTRASKAIDALQLLINPAISHNDLRDRSEMLFNSMARMMRWASPTDENYYDQFPPAALPDDLVLIASDGSQIFPNQQYAKPNVDLPWGLTNISGKVWERAAGQFKLMQDFRQSMVLLENEIYGVNGPIVSDSHISLLRDVREREILSDLSTPYAGQLVFTLNDSPLELWGSFDNALSGSYQSSLVQTIAAYERLVNQNVVFAGYTDAPRSDLMVRMLEIALTVNKSLKDFRETWREREFPGVFDRLLLARWLRPGNRTAVFRLMTQAKGAYSGNVRLRPYFFYLNTGKDSHPRIARVDIPAYLVLANDKTRIGQLHAVILDQCAKNPARYPYILSRCHRDAVVTSDDAEIVQGMIIKELLRYENEYPIARPKNISKQT